MIKWGTFGQQIWGTFGQQIWGTYGQFLKKIGNAINFYNLV
jgi:hypothetical protein